MNDRDISPSVWRYGLALMIVIAGFAAFAWYLSSGISSTIGGLSQMAAPGEARAVSQRSQVSIPSFMKIRATSMAASI